MSRELLSRAWAAAAGPGDGPLSIDLDSTICETYGLAKEGARHHSYTGQRGYHPLLAIAAGTGDVLMARLRKGRANTVRGAAHFLRETVGRVRYGGARGQLTVRADSGFYTHAIVAVCRKMDVRYSITVRQQAKACGISSRPYPRLTGRRFPTGWTAPPTWRRPPTSPSRDEPDAAPVRLIVRRVQPTPGSQLALFASYRYHGCITDRDGDTLALEADHRRHAEIENAIRDLKYGVGLNPSPLGPLRRQRRLAGGAGDGPQPCMLNEDFTEVEWVRQTDQVLVIKDRCSARVAAPVPKEPEQLPGPNRARIVQERASTPLGLHRRQSWGKKEST